MLYKLTYLYVIIRKMDYQNCFNFVIAAGGNERVVIRALARPQVEPAVRLLLWRSASQQIRH